MLGEVEGETLGDVLGEKEGETLGAADGISDGSSELKIWIRGQAGENMSSNTNEESQTEPRRPIQDKPKQLAFHTLSGASIWSIYLEHQPP